MSVFFVTQPIWLAAFRGCGVEMRVLVEVLPRSIFSDVPVSMRDELIADWRARAAGELWRPAASLSLGVRLCLTLGLRA